MKLDNEQFKARAAETTSIFGKLKQALSNVGNNKLGKVTNDLAGIQRSANGINLSSLASSVDSIASRFSTLGVVATTALANITNRAVNAGLQLQRSLSTQPIMDGFREYEMKMGSIQTILSNTEWMGTNLDDVKKSLGELNDYADQTIYNFAQMTQNIGRFTAAGASLDDATIAIKGMGNLAATAGANTEQLNRAMYQVSQALAGGTFQLMDWNSLEEASMGGKKTKDALMATADALGVARDKSKSFRESLKDGWLTSEVFLETMKQFGNDESMIKAATTVRTFTGMMDALKESIGSGWAESWEIIFGDFEQATVFWTAISDLIGGVFDKQTKARNDLLRSLANDGGLEKLGEVIQNVGTPIIQIFKSIGEAFKNAFPSNGGQGILNAVAGLANLTEHLRMSDSTVKNVTTIFTGLFSIISSGIQIVKIFGTAIMSLLPGFDSAGGGVLDLVARIFELPIAFNEYLKTGALAEKLTNGLSTVFAGLGSVLSFIGNGFRGFADVVGQSISILASGDFTGGAMSKENPLVGILMGLREAFASTFNYIASINFGAIWGGISSFFEGIGDTFSWAKDKLAGFVDFIKNIIPTISDNQGWLLAGGGIAALSAIIWKAYEMVRNLQSPFKMVNDLTEVVESVGDALGAFTLGIHVKSLLTIALAVGVLAVSLKMLSDLDAGQITTGLYMIVGSLTAMVGALAIMSKFDITGSFGATLAIVGMSVAIAALAGAVKILSNMSYGEITKGIVGLVGILGTLSGAIILMSTYGAAFSVGALQFIAIAGAITILLFAINKIADINPGDIAKGLTTLGILLAEMALFIKLASTRSATLTASAAGILATAGAIVIMVHAMKQIADLNIGEIVKGLGSIGILLGMLGTFAVVSSNKGLMSTGTGLLLMAGALTALIVPILTLGNTPLDTLAKGLGAMAIALVALGATSKLMTASIPAAIAIGLLAVSLNLLIVPIAALGAMSWQSLALGIGAVAVALLAIGGVAALLGAATLPMLGFGVAILALGAGMALLGKGLVIFSTMAVASMTVAITAIGAFITGFIALLPAITDLVAKIGTAILGVMVNMAPKIADALGELITTIISKIKEYAPNILDLVADILLMVLDKLSGFIVDAVDVVLDLLVALVDTISSFVTNFIDAATELILAFLKGLQDNIPQVIDAMIEFVIELISSMANTIEERGPEFINQWLRLMAAVVELVVQAGISMINALFGWIPGVTEATTAIGETAGEYIKEHFKAVEIGEEKGKDFSTALEGTTALSKTAGTNIANAGLDGAKSVDASSAGIFFGQGFANGIGDKNVLSQAVGAAKTLAKAAYNKIVEVMDINSPSRETFALGEHTGQGFANGIAVKEKSIVESIFKWLPGMDKATTEVSKSTAKKGEVVGEKTVQGISKGVSKGVTKQKPKVVKKVKDLAAEASKSFKTAMDNAEYKFDMGKINSKQYIAEIEKIKRSYSKYPKLVKEAELEIMNIRKKSNEDHLKYLENQYELGEINSKQYIAQLRKMEKEYAKKPLEAQKIRLKIKKIEEDGVKERQQIAKEEFDSFKNVLSDKKYYNELSLADELKAWTEMQSKYKKGTEERKEADKEVYRLKNEINSRLISLNEEYIGKIKDLQQQEIDSIKAVNDEYDSEYESRKDRLANFTGIFEEVAKKEEVSGQKLLENLKSQFTTLTQWTTDIQKLASRGLDTALLGVLQEMGPSAATEINALTTMTDSQLAEYAEVWRKKNELAKTQTTAELEDLRKKADEKITQIKKETEATLEKYKEEWLNKIREIKDGTTDQFVSLNSDMNAIGMNAMEGLKVGLESKRGELMGLASEIANEIAATIAAALQVNSPSKVTTRIGEFVGDGVVVGMDNRIKAVGDSAKNLAVTAKDSLNKFIQGLDFPELENEVHVKAVVTYDKESLDALNREFAFKPDVSRTVQTANAINTDKRQNDDTYRSKQDPQPNEQPQVNIKQELNFHSKELTPSEVARKNIRASRELAMQWK